PSVVGDYPMVRRAGLLALLGLGLGAAGCMPGEHYGRPLLQGPGPGPRPTPPMMMAPPMMAPPAAMAYAPPSPMPATPMPLPTEKFKVTHPEYVLEVPDVVLIDVVRAMPKAPYRVQPTDTLTINVSPTGSEQPINGSYAIGPDGRVTLG